MTKFVTSGERVNDQILEMGDNSNLRQQDLFVCVEVLRPSQPNGVMSSAVILPNHTIY